MGHSLKRLPLVLAIASCLGLVRPAPAEEPRKDRDGAIRALCSKLGIGEGTIVADIGCGSGRDSFVLASVVGKKGTVLAEEIDPGKLKEVLDGSRGKGLPQVVPVLGQSDDPRLPDGLSDLIYMHLVFHHFSDPRAMLRSFLRDLKPGGYLVVVDQGRGPPTDWAPGDRREKEHHLTGETTVVRLAREEGFLFVDAPDDIWFEQGPFVLVFRRPPASREAQAVEPAGDPDRAAPMDLEKAIGALPSAGKDEKTVLFALDAGRALIPALREKVKGVYDIVLEEWETSKDELPEGASGEVVRTEKGDLRLPDGAVVGAVLFVDAYHRLWDPSRILGKLRERMPQGSRLTVLDKRGPDGEPRRLAGHRRRISPALVREELEKAGFELAGEADAPAADRFVLIFRPKPLPEKERLF